MSDSVLVQVPVSPQAAAALKDDARREKVGKLMSDLLRPPTPADDPLAALIAKIKTDARRGGLTDQEIDAELAAHSGERRH